MSDLQEIFKDIIDKAIANGLFNTGVAMQGKMITVATMCSDTESSRLAWQMLQDVLANPMNLLGFGASFGIFEIWCIYEDKVSAQLRSSL